MNMALNDKKTGFGFDMGERFNKVTNKTDDELNFDDIGVVKTEVEEPEQKEFKNKRVQLLTYESLINRMDKYAAKRGVSRVAVFEAAMNAYLDMVDPQK